MFTSSLLDPAVAGQVPEGRGGFAKKIKIKPISKICIIFIPDYNYYIPIYLLPIITMVPTIEGWNITPENVTNLTDEEIAIVQAEANKRISANLENTQKPETEEKKESKETIEKAPELDKENFRIDSTNWKEITAPNRVKVKENPEGDVREYLEGKYKWEQLFTPDSALREANKAGKTLPASWTTYRDIIEKKYEWNYQKFIEGENMIFVGWRTNIYKTFNFIDEIFGLCCADGSSFLGDSDKWNNDKWSKNHGFSVRCLKE